MRRDRLPIVFFLALALGAGAVAAGGPIAWAIVIMGLPFLAFFLLLGGVAHGHVDNGHFRSPEPKTGPPAG